MGYQQIIIFGEVLFDCFPDNTALLGGAPFNVAWHLCAFGVPPLFISSVGNDDRGHRIRNTMQEWGLDVSGLEKRYPAVSRYSGPAKPDISQYPGIDSKYDESLCIYGCQSQVSLVDAFSSVLLLGKIKGWSMDVMLERAQQFASKVITIRSAITSDRSFYQPFLDDWN